MSYDRADFLATVAKRRESLNREHLPMYQMLAAAGVVANQLLTDRDYWNRYLQYLQGLVEKTRLRKEEAQRKQNDPAIWDSQQLAKLKSDVLTADAMIDAWTIAMQLPKAMFEDGQKAQEIINKFAGENDTVTGQTGT